MVEQIGPREDTAVTTVVSIVHRSINSINTAGHSSSSVGSVAIKCIPCQTRFEKKKKCNLSKWVAAFFLRCQRYHQHTSRGFEIRTVVLLSISIVPPEEPPISPAQRRQGPPATPQDFTLAVTANVVASRGHPNLDAKPTKFYPVPGVNVLRGIELYRFSSIPVVDY